MGCKKRVGEEREKTDEGMFQFSLGGLKITAAATWESVDFKSETNYATIKLYLKVCKNHSKIL